MVNGQSLGLHSPLLVNSICCNPALAHHSTTTRPCPPQYHYQTLPTTVPLPDLDRHSTTTRPCPPQYHYQTLPTTVPLPDLAHHSTTTRPCPPQYHYQTLPTTVPLPDLAHHSTTTRPCPPQYHYQTQLIFSGNSHNTIVDLPMFSVPVIAAAYNTHYVQTLI